ncbi:MAG: hydroxymethylbilane synthase [Chloroflexota bacterium]
MVGAGAARPAGLIVTEPAIPRRIRIGTRGSLLAMRQAARVAELLRDRHPALEIDLVPIDTQGDRDKTSSLTEIGGAGVFTGAVQGELLAGAVDIAVHSAKDLPARSPDGLAIVAIPGREDARDVVVSRHRTGLAGLPHSPVIGTSSRRRAMEVLALRPDARIRDLRGNVDTRLRKAQSPDYDAVVLAAAGLSRLGLLEHADEFLDLDLFIPAPGQGALAVEARAGDAGVIAALRAIDDSEAAAAVHAERAFLAAMGAGCTVPLGAHVRREDGEWILRAVFGDDPATAARIVRRLDPRELATGAVEAARDLATGIAAPGVGPRVLVTRAATQAGPLSAALAGAGMTPVEYPVIRIEQSGPSEQVEAAAREIAAGRIDWVVFTSVNAVDAFASLLGRFSTSRAMDRVRIAAVGRATAAAAARHGWETALAPAVATGAALAADLAGAVSADERVLLPRGDIARDEVEAALRQAGADVTAVVVYRTVPETRRGWHDPAVERGEFDAVTLASPSAVRNLAARLGGIAPLERARVVCVGPVTAAEARERGLPVDAVAVDASVEGLVAAVRAALPELATGVAAGEVRPEERSS